jgi:hypothetical protein
MEADGRMRKVLALAIQEVNPGSTLADIEMKIEYMHGQATTNKRLYLELERTIPVMPTHIKVPGTMGGLLEILHTDPFDYVAHMKTKLGLRVGFFSQYATPIKGNPSLKTIDPKILQKRIDEFQADTGNGIALKRLYAALNGVPVVDGFVISPSMPGFLAYRAFSNYVAVAKSLWLTNSAWVNLLEPVIRTPGTVGWRRFSISTVEFASKGIPHALAKGANVLTGKRITLLNDWTTNDAWSIMKEQMIRQGTMALRLANFTINPQDTIRSTSRAVSQTVSKASATTGAITFGEHFAAESAHIMADELRAGRGSKFDVERLRVLGYPENEITKIIAGVAKQEVYDGLPARAVTTQMGTNTLPAERSLWHNWRHAGDILIFDKYGANAFRYWNQVLRAIYQERKGNPTSQYIGVRKYMENTYMIGSSLVPGKTFSPTLTTITGTSIAAGILVQAILRPMLQYGLEGFKYLGGDDREKDPENNEFKRWSLMIADAFMQSATSAPWGNMYTDWRNGRANLGRTVTSSILPASVVVGMIDFFGGTGNYANKSMPDKLVALIRNNAPLSNTAATWLGISVLGERDPALRAARSHVTKWAQQHGQEAQFGAYAQKQNEEFYKAINSAYEYMLNTGREYVEQDGHKLRTNWKKNDAAYVGMISQIEKAFQIVDNTKLDQTLDERKESIASSFEGKRIFLKLNEKNRVLYRQVMSKDVQDKIAEHDIMVTLIAQMIRYGE